MIMPVLMEKEIFINRIIAANYEHLSAIQDPIRGKILQLLYKKQLNADQITRKLKKSGYKKAITTIRHHIDILKDSGLIEIVKIEELHGGITKYYSSSIKFLDFTISDDFEKNYSKTIEKTSLKLTKIVNSISKNFPKTRKVNQINHNHYVTIEILNRAITNVLEKK